jgi:sugar/nucleoside kinase (ribokinase family)
MSRIFNKVVGTGGVGTGEIYRLEGSHTLGREESRAGHLLPYRDYCKLHIILHYIAILTNKMKPEVQVIPVSAVGDDVRGDSIKEELLNVGMNIEYLKTVEDAPTLHSICIQYPDGSGGNITESRSACSKVDSDMLKDAIEVVDEKTIVLAVPEVPLKSRFDFIGMGAKKEAFIAASFTSHEMKELEQSSVLKYIDLLSVNMDEARMLSGIEKDMKPADVVSACIDKLVKLNPQIKFTVTDGAKGVYACENGKLEYHPVFQANAVNTAGAGDAFLAGLIIGTLKGQPIVGDQKHSCLRYAIALAGMSVTSKNTIHFGITSEALEEFISVFKIDR